MQENTRDEQVKVYEIGYLFVSSIPQEKVADHTALLMDVLVKAGATTIAQEDPELRPLAYTMTKKIAGIHQRFTEAYFGWVKFELGTQAIESVKKSLDAMDGLLRYLLIITVKENTYLGKRTPAADLVANKDIGVIAPTVAPVLAAATTEEMDKTIDDIVKEA